MISIGPMTSEVINESPISLRSSYLNNRSDFFRKYAAFLKKNNGENRILSSAKHESQQEGHFLSLILFLISLALLLNQMSDNEFSLTLPTMALSCMILQRDTSPDGRIKIL
jgi:hypothetical protein